MDFYFTHGRHGYILQSNRSLAPSQAWSTLAGVICVSHFVEGYLRKWAPPGIFEIPVEPLGDDPLTLEAFPLRGELTTSSLLSWPVVGGAEGQSRAAVGGRVPLKVVPLSAWGCFGSPPFPNLGLSAAARARKRLSNRQGDGAGPSVCGPIDSVRNEIENGGQLCIGVLKLSPEKGCSIVWEVARRLPHLRCGECQMF